MPVLGWVKPFKAWRPLLNSYTRKSLKEADNRESKRDLYRNQNIKGMSLIAWNNMFKARNTNYFQTNAFSDYIIHLAGLYEKPFLSRVSTKCMLGAILF